MPKANKDNYDAIIIGAGMSGLVCGCYLAKAGMKVLIVEQHDKPGGYFSSFKRREFLFDAAAHSFGNYREGGHVRKVLTELGIGKLIKIKRFDPSNIIITPDFKITLQNDIKVTIANLSNIFPKEKDNIVKFFKFLASADQSEFTKLRNMTFSSLLNSFFSNSKLINSLAVPVFGSGGLPPSSMHAFIGAKIFSEFILDGGYYPEGGIQNLPNAVAHVIKQHRGTILYRNLVKKIIVKNNAVMGIETDNNKEFIAKHVISACDISQTFKTFLGKSLVSNGIEHELNNMIPSLSFFILYIGLDRPFEGLPPNGTNIWYLPYYDLDRIYLNIKECYFEDAGMYLLRLSPDKKTLIASFLATFKTRSFWNHHKMRIAQNFLNRIAELIPNLKKHILYFDVATPATLHRYTLNDEGAAFGWAKIPSQIFNPIFSNASFIKGLYLTGHWTGIGFGMPGACYSGHDVAKRILRRENIISIRLPKVDKAAHFV
jgi:phytoene dehydrogenase-like protein